MHSSNRINQSLRLYCRFNRELSESSKPVLIIETALIIVHKVYSEIRKYSQLWFEVQYVRKIRTLIIIDRFSKKVRESINGETGK